MVVEVGAPSTMAWEIARTARETMAERSFMVCRLGIVVLGVKME